MSTPTTAQSQAIADEIREDCISLEPCKPGKAHELCRTCQWADFILGQQKRIEAVLGRLEVVEKTTLKNTDWGYHEYIWKTLISDIRKRLEAE